MRVVRLLGCLCKDTAMIYIKMVNTVEKVTIEGDGPVIVYINYLAYKVLEYRKAREILRESARTIG